MPCSPLLLFPATQQSSNPSLPPPWHPSPSSTAPALNVVWHSLWLGQHFGSGVLLVVVAESGPVCVCVRGEGEVEEERGLEGWRGGGGGSMRPKSPVCYTPLLLSATPPFLSPLSFLSFFYAASSPFGGHLWRWEGVRGVRGWTCSLAAP